MASEVDAINEDAEALKRDGALYDQEEDAIDAFMGSASSLSASESDRPPGINFGDREAYSETAVPSSSLVSVAAVQNQSCSALNAQESNQHDSTSNSELAFNTAEGSDAAFSFPFPSMSSNQTEELFREQVDEICSDCPPSHSRQPRVQPAQSDRDAADFRQMMKASEPRFDGDERMAELETQQPDQSQQYQQHQFENQPEQQYHEPQDTALKEHDSPTPSPQSQLRYPAPAQQQPQNQESSDSNRDDPDAATPSPLKQQQQLSKAPARLSKASKPSSSSSVTTGSKRSAPSPASTSASASDSAKPFSWNDILRVQNMIERCLQQYLSKNEILQTLKDQAQVDPEFTHVVWQKLEEQNPSFFRAYNVQLQLKEQILAFNYLVTQQKEMVMNRSTPHATAASSSSLALPLQVDSRVFMPSQEPSSASASSQSTQQQPSGSGKPASSLAVQFNMPPPSPLPLPSPIKTDLDTHAFFT